MIRPQIHMANFENLLINCIFRTLLNRGYANESRNKKLGGDEILKISNKNLVAKTEENYEEFEHRKYVEIKPLDYREEILKCQIDDMEREKWEMFIKLKNDRPDLNLTYSDISRSSSESEDENSEPRKKYKYEEVDENYDLKKVVQVKYDVLEDKHRYGEVLNMRSHILDKEEKELLAQEELLADSTDEDETGNGTVGGAGARATSGFPVSDDTRHKNSKSVDTWPPALEMTKLVTESGGNSTSMKMASFGLEETTSVLRFRAGLNELRMRQEEKTKMMDSTKTPTNFKKYGENNTEIQCKICGDKYTFNHMEHICYICIVNRTCDQL